VTSTTSFGRVRRGVRLTGRGSGAGTLGSRTAFCWKGGAGSFSARHLLVVYTAAILPEWTPPVGLVRFVFGTGALGASAGLFMRGRPGEVRTNDEVWSLQPMGAPANIDGAGIGFRALRFFFLPFLVQPHPPGEAVIDGRKEGMMHHPRSIDWPEVNLHLRFRWPSNED
jgi:hypothetical protein